MGIFSRIFSSSDTIKEGISMIRDTGDALFYTEEEKAADRRESASAERKMIIDWMETTKGQNLGRRLLALMITGVWLVMYVISAILSTAAIWADDTEKWVASAKLIGDYSYQMNGAMMLILAFYFAAPHMGKIVEGALNKFSGHGAVK